MKAMKIAGGKKNSAISLKSFFSHISIDCLAACMYFLCMPFTIVSTPFGSVLKLLTVPVVAVLGAKLFLGETKSIRLNTVHLLYGAYIIFTFFQLLYFRDERAVQSTGEMLQTFLVFLLISMRIYNRYEQELMETCWIIVGFICILLCLYSDDTLDGRTVIVIFGSYEDPNQFSAYFTLPVMICLKRIIERRKLLPLYVAEIILIIYSILTMGSRGGLIGIVVGIAFFMIIGARGVKAKVGIIIVGILCTVLVVTVVFPLLPQNIQERFTVENVIESRGTGRFDIWEFCIDYTTESPSRIILGSGLLSTYSIFPEHREVDNFVAHNQVIQSFFDQGVIGLSLYLAYIMACIFRNIKKNPYYSSAMVSMFAFSMSLTMYVFKPYINVIMMCALNIEGNTESGENALGKELRSV